MKKNLTAIALVILAGAMVVFAYIFYQSSAKATASLQNSINQATQGTSNVNDLAGTINKFLTGNG